MMTRSYFWIYMLECENGAFYTGYTKNLVRRFRQHVEGTAGVRYTRSHKPLRIAQCWRLYEPVGDALKIERLIKVCGRPAKSRLVRDPSCLKEMAAAKLGSRIRLFGFDPSEVERAARNLAVDEVRGAPDPFASIPPDGRQAPTRRKNTAKRP